MNPKTACLKRREEEKSEESGSNKQFPPASGMVAALHGHHLSAAPAPGTALLLDPFKVSEMA
jgi:hypothetical protein